ncbi:4931_t:CDS:2 [Diversispora eburnea]|uniref:4931_t:CDS:1 n=1 Tax=Diversispora eburnea TaxID=1213867 RepID=A0A9N8YQL4_9GLOM|nr:4931_t:CDS:2 [Diversispora eburnea]
MVQGYCEGVIGRFRGKDVSFYNPLKSSNSLKPGDHLSDEIISSDTIQMRSRASSISSIDIDSGRNSPCSPVPSLSKSTIPSSINDDVNGNSSQTWTNTKDIENSLNNNNVLSSTSSSLNSNNLDGSLASQKKTSLISNDQSKLPPLSFNGNSQKAHYNQDNQDVQSLKNSPRKMSISPSIQLDQSFNPRRKNSAPLISNNEIQINSGSFRKNSAPTTLIDKGKLMRKTSHDDIGSQISFGSTIYVPTKSDNNKTATSSDSSPNSSINSIQRTQDLEPTTPMTPRTPVSPTSFLNVGPPQPTPTQVPNPDRPVIIKPPVRKSSIIPDSLQNYEKRPQENIRSVSGRNSPSLPASPTSPIISKPKIQLNSSGISNKGNPTNQHDRSTSPIPQICIDKQDMNIHLNNVVNRNNNSSNKPVPSSQSIPLIKVVDSDSYESDFGIKKAPGSANDFSPPMPAFMIEAANDISGNESEDLSSEDEDDSDEKFLEDNNRTSQSKKDKVVAIDEYGFVHNVAEEEIPEGADGVQRIVKALGSSERNSRTIRLYREREAKWVSILANMDPTMSRGSKKIKKLVRLGIPESVRGKSWQLLAGVHKYRQRGVYDDLCKRENLPIYDVIERDIRRCYPDHIQFREDTGFGQDDLHNILRAYAHYNQSVGYCQGMGRLVGMMLMQMPAEDTFWLLVATIEEYMVGYFTPTLSQVRIDSIVFKHLLFEHDPKLAQHLADNDIVPLTYTTQWFMTIFTMALPWASVLRVWDIFYLEGVKFFFRVGLAILDCTREHILKSCPSTSEILEFLLHIPPEFLTPNLLLEAAFKIKVKSSTIRRMTKRVSEIESNNSSGTDTPNPIYSVVKDKRNIMKKSKSTDKLRIDGIEFKIIGEGSNS